MEFENLRCISPCCFIQCLLEDRQTFKHGQVDKCHICNGSFSIWNSFLGINMPYFVIHAPISPITLGFGLYGF